MLTTFPVPFLSLTADAVRDLQGQDALYSLWTVFTKCKESVQDGRRLENISWRLWYRELIHAQLPYQPLTPNSTTPQPKRDRSRSSYFPASANEKVSPHLHVLSSGLPSPSDQPSPSPLPPPMPSLVPPSTPERPRISPHSAAPAPNSFSRGQPAVCVGRLIVDMLPNHLSFPQPKPTISSTTPLAVSPTPPPTVQPSESCDPNLPLVRLPTAADTPCPRVVVVNPTPHPTPPTTPILYNDSLSVIQPSSTFLLPPLPPPTLRPTAPSAGAHSQQLSQLQPSLMPRDTLPPAPARIPDASSLTRQPDRRFFLQQSPEEASPEQADSTASGKSPSDLFEASSATSSQVKSMVTDMDDDKMEEQVDEEGEEDDRQSTTAAVGPEAKHSTQARQGKPKRVKEVGKRPLVKRSHSAKHVAPLMVRKLSAHQQQPQSDRIDKKGAMFNIGSGSSNGSKSANGSTTRGHSKTPSLVNGLTAIRPISPPKAYPPPKGFVNGHIVTNSALNGHPNANGNMKTNTAHNANGNANGTAQLRKIVVANTSSEDYETTDGEDSEEWASEETDGEDKARKAEKTRLHEAALEAQRQRELFAKVPKRSYSILNRTQSGLLSQLMNPNPAIFPPNHPYRLSRSSADISRQYQPLQQHAPVPQRSTSAYAPPRLSTSKSSAALPMAAQVTAISSSRPLSSTISKRPENEKNGYRPKGPPKEQEMEDDSGDDADDKIQISQSVAQQKLLALISRRSPRQGTSSHLIQPISTEAGPGASSSTTVPIPLGHPYNLPAAAPPMTPRTTRRRMLKTELSESMRRQLLWERQVSSNANPALAARRANQGLRPLASANSEDTRDATTEAQDERRRRAMARNRSWADDYHYSGW